MNQKIDEEKISRWGLSWCVFLQPQLPGQIGAALVCVPTAPASWEDGGRAGVCSPSPSILGARSLDSETSLQKGNNLRMEVQKKMKNVTKPHHINTMKRLYV